MSSSATSSTFVDDRAVDTPVDPRRFGVVGRSAAMQRVFRMVGKVAGSDTTLMITGETGTGKGVLARAIHLQSRRRQRPFVQINCGAIPEGLLESELFGHVRGAFTGATAAKTGKFEQARGGTIFLDEIGDMSLDLQVKLLRVLEEREIEPVGGSQSLTVDVRVLAATHRDLEEAVQAGRFREDLYYRLYVIPVALPPLRQRRDDIPLLVEAFLDEFARRRNTEPVRMSPEVLHHLNGYHWPGNVRELRNLVERLVVLSESGRIDLNDLPAKFSPAVQRPPEGVTLGDEGLCLATAVTEFEKRIILETLEKTQWVKNRAAKLLNVNRTTLVEKIKRYNLNRSS